MDIKTIMTVGVVGAGTMGNGIAQVAAQAGFSVKMSDVTEDFVRRGMSAIEKNLGRMVNRDKISKEEAERVFSRIEPLVGYEGLKDCDFIIEAVFEQMEVKKQIYGQLEEIVKPEAYFASNTSGLSITEMASATRRPQKFVGMHFFNPVPVMKLVEVIKGNDTSEETFFLAQAMAKKMGKEPIAVQEAPLFCVNRILVPMLNEAMFVLMEGIASAEDIDKGMMMGCNHPIGPLALSDMIGLDTMLYVAETLYQETGDSKYRPCPLLRKLVRAGHLGRKSGRGFYTYS